MSAETVDGGKLREAATKKDDQSILLQIANKNMVALEVKYHKRCYDKYTSFLRTTTQSKGKETEQHDFKYEKSFDVFCEEFVKEKLIKQENIQPFASYRLALCKKKVLKSYNYIVWPLKLFVLTLKLFVLTSKHRVGGVKLLVSKTKRLVIGSENYSCASYYQKFLIICLQQ